MSIWYFSINGDIKGPVPGDTITQSVIDGVIPIDSLVWKEGMQNWIPYSSSELASLTQTSTLVPPPLPKSIAKLKTKSQEKYSPRLPLMFLLGMFFLVLFLYRSSVVSLFSKIGLASRPITEIESEISASVMQELSKDGIVCEIRSLSLIKNGKNHYYGMATVGSDTQFKIDVIYDKKSIMWEISPIDMLAIHSACSSSRP